MPCFEAPVWERISAEALRQIRLAEPQQRSRFPGVNLGTRTLGSGLLLRRGLIYGAGRGMVLCRRGV